jgi:acyl-CoA synthetase (AMP-forming)/AMP-acid ligase II
VRADLSAPRFCISAGSPLPTGAEERLPSALTPNLYGYYGATETGWTTAGDLGRLDEEGYLYLVDRAKDMIISGGVNVYPAETEEVLLAVPGTEEVAVIGIPHERWGEAVHAVAVLAPGTDRATWEDAARAAAAGRLAGYQRPQSHAVVDALPRTHSGKLLRREIRAPYRSAG